MRFISILLQWFSTKQPDPDNTETKKAVIQLILIDNFLVLLIAFWLGISFAINYPEVAQDFLDVFGWIGRILNN
jgi:hypothetical protein